MKNILVIDIGGSNVKVRASGQAEARKLRSGPKLTAAAMVEGVQALAQGRDCDAVAIGYPGVVHHDAPQTEPHNLGPGWVGFDYAAAFGKPVKMINDAAMQALGSYQGGTMLFLGLGTGLGAALVVNGQVVPTEIAHLPYRRSTFEHHVGAAALRRLGRGKWQARVFDAAGRLATALLPDDVVLGGGNARLLEALPAGWRRVDNSHAFEGGLRLWKGRAQGRP